jgi:hypothetical protein
LEWEELGIRGRRFLQQFKQGTEYWIRVCIAVGMEKTRVERIPEVEHCVTGIGPDRYCREPSP